MKARIVTILSLLTAAAVFIVVSMVDTGTMAQQAGGLDGPTEVADCPSDMCYSHETLSDEEYYKQQTEESRFPCTCGVFYNPSCHYEYIPAFDCIPWWHEDGVSTTMEWEGVVSSTTAWGVKKRASSRTQLSLVCPIPSDHGVSSIKNYGNPARVEGYFYNWASTSGSNRAYMAVYSANAGSSLTSQGSISDGTSGQRTLVVSPTGTAYAFWWAHVKIAYSASDNNISSLHGISVCYDPD